MSCYRHLNMGIHFDSVNSLALNCDAVPFNPALFFPNMVVFKIVLRRAVTSQTEYIYNVCTVVAGVLLTLSLSNAIQTFFLLWSPSLIWESLLMCSTTLLRIVTSFHLIQRFFPQAWLAKPQQNPEVGLTNPNARRCVLQKGCDNHRKTSLLGFSGSIPEDEAGFATNPSAVHPEDREKFNSAKVCLYPLLCIKSTSSLRIKFLIYLVLRTTSRYLWFLNMV